MVTNKEMNEVENAIETLANFTNESFIDVVYKMFYNVNEIESKGKLDANDIAEVYSELQLANDLKISTNE